MSQDEQNSTNRDINVPPVLPLILKQFCKAAIRTQPYDLIKWSVSYFRSLADDEEPPVKTRLEYSPPCTITGLTLGFLRVLRRQFGDYNKILPIKTVLFKWDSLCLDRQDFNVIISIGNFYEKCEVKQFLAIAVALISSSLSETMTMICELFTHEPGGGSAMIPVALFIELFGYFVSLQYSDERTIVINDEYDMDKKNDIPVLDISLQGDISSDSAENYFATDKNSYSTDFSTMTKCNDENGTLKMEQFFTYYKKINAFYSGFGQPLTPEEVNNVIIWFSECAKYQEGMVGPRNIRHFNCPLMDKQEYMD